MPVKNIRTDETIENFPEILEGLFSPLIEHDVIEHGFVPEHDPREEYWCFNTPETGLNRCRSITKLGNVVCAPVTAYHRPRQSNLLRLGPYLIEPDIDLSKPGGEASGSCIVLPTLTEIWLYANEEWERIAGIEKYVVGMRNETPFTLVQREESIYYVLFQLPVVYNTELTNPLLDDSFKKAYKEV